MTDRVYSTDAYAFEVDATVVDVDADESRVLLDRTVFYPGGGGQPPDRGILLVGGDAAAAEVAGDRLEVVGVGEDRRGVWHQVTGGLPPVGSRVHGRLDVDRRLALMRTHTAMHALCGVVWERYRSPVTGGNMEPGVGRLDFELPDWDPDDKATIETALQAELDAARPVEVAFLPRAEADADPSLIRTKVSLLPDDLAVVRVIDIVGLDRQADGGTHVRSTSEVGRVRVAKVESKGRGFRRIRLALDEPSG
ncbi:alanyl-tRNA editing protein [Nitriliruptor alkaliphilus]|uniref:alanyl-tRNA editing protein n=1 Tax=Nitriliruptor alkaliphilus TaxID=427918 RepID=UPI000B209027|nr:alanyl-tRNA editing protein [Nitriliruptor alkaliphilus]